MINNSRSLISLILSIMIVLTQNLPLTSQANDGAIDNLLSSLNAVKDSAKFNLDSNPKLIIAYKSLAKLIEENRKSGSSQTEILKWLSPDKKNEAYWIKTLKQIPPGSFPLVQALEQGLSIHVHGRIHIIQISSVKPLKVSINGIEALLSSDRNPQKDQIIIERLLERAESKGLPDTTSKRGPLWPLINEAYAIGPVLLAIVAVAVGLSALAVLDSVAVFIKIRFFMEKLDSEANKCESNRVTYTPPELAIRKLFEASQKSLENCQKEIIESQGDSIKLLMFGPPMMSETESKSICLSLRRLQECVVKAATVPGSAVSNTKAGKEIVDSLKGNPPSNKGQSPK